MATYNKLDDSRMEEIVAPVTPEPTINVFNIDDLKRQELAIVTSINDFVESKKAELTKVRERIATAEGLGLKTAEVLQAEALVEEEAELPK